MIMDDDVLPVGGRISRAPITPNAMNPIIQPKKPPCHYDSKTLSAREKWKLWSRASINLLGEQFWVIKGKAVVKEVIGRCISCKKRMAPRITQEMAELPKIRLTTYEPPFTYSGIDYFGPFCVKRGRGKVAEKRWGAIFVCMNSRAIHLEVTRTLETDDFILVPDEISQ